MADSRRYYDWYGKARLDFDAARILRENHADNSLAAFHCQQAVEKMLKGYILKHTERLKDGHSLVFLVRQAGLFDPDIRRFIKDCAFVNQFYIETRYPADMPDEVDNMEMDECMSVTSDVLGYILNKEKGESK